MTAPQYNEQYCEKHNQYYAEFLNKCPICRGEELDGFMKITYHGSLEENKMDEKEI